MAAEDILRSLFGIPASIAMQPDEEGELSSAGQAVRNMLLGRPEMQDVTQAAIPKAASGAGLGALAGALAGLVPGAKEVAGTGVTALRGALGTPEGATVAGGAGGALLRSVLSGKADEENVEVAQRAKQKELGSRVPGVPAIDQEVVGEVSTRAGIDLLTGGPADKEAQRLAGFESRRQAQEDVALRQVLGIGKIEDLEREVRSERASIAEQIAGLRSSTPQRDEFSERLVSLLGVGLPSALAGSRAGVQSALMQSQAVGQQIAAGEAATQKQIKDLQGRADKLLSTQLQTVTSSIEAEGKLGSQLARESTAFKEAVSQTRKAEDEGRLDPSQRLDVGSSRFDSLGVTLGKDKLFRAAGAPQLGTEDKKILSGLVRTAPVIQDNLRTLQAIIEQVGVTGDAALSEPVTITDPKTGAPKTFRNAGAAMETLSTLFKANVKDIENLGALGQDVLDFTSRLMDDPVVYLGAVKDLATEGGQAQKISQQVDVLVDNYTSQAETFKEANQIKTLSDLNREKVQLGELRGFSELPTDRLVPGHEDKVIKFVDPSDGKVYLLNQAELDEILKNSRRK